jgi:hypothetical protein
MNRRQFAIASLPAAILTGCHSGTKPSRDATLLHNKEVSEAVSELDQSMNHLDMRLTAFGPENWRDALSSLQSTVVRLHSAVDELKRSLGYTDTGEPQSGNQSSDGPPQEPTKS